MTDPIDIKIPKASIFLSRIRARSTFHFGECFLMATRSTNTSTAIMKSSAATGQKSVKVSKILIIGSEPEVSPHFPAPDQQLMTSSGG